MNLEAVKAARFSVLGEECRFNVANYQNNNRIALQVVTVEYGEPYGVLSVNMPNCAIPDGCIAVKDYSENEELARVAFDTGVFEKTGVTADGMPIWKIK
jgi:hypothetical protein